MEVFEQSTAASSLLLCKFIFFYVCCHFGSFSPHPCGGAADFSICLGHHALQSLLLGSSSSRTPRPALHCPRQRSQAGLLAVPQGPTLQGVVQELPRQAACPSAAHRGGQQQPAKNSKQLQELAKSLLAVRVLPSMLLEEQEQQERQERQRGYSSCGRCGCCFCRCCRLQRLQEGRRQPAHADHSCSSWLSVAAQRESAKAGLPSLISGVCPS
mmetsp:Transcript_15645/g.23853  ORF Transcript_15645/g.23853 Transcript_15645/m.23853 type:complete len:213 (-) Transcript_15645:42-680(-)